MERVFLIIWLSLISQCLQAQLLFPYPGNNRWGYVDSNTNWVISPRFTEASFFQQQLAIVRDSLGRQRLIDKQGNYLTDTAAYQKLSFTTNQYISASFRDSVCLLDSNLQELPGRRFLGDNITWEAELKAYILNRGYYFPETGIYHRTEVIKQETDTTLIVWEPERIYPGKNGSYYLKTRETYVRRAPPKRKRKKGESYISSRLMYYCVLPGGELVPWKKTNDTCPCWPFQLQYRNSNWAVRYQNTFELIEKRDSLIIAGPFYLNTTWPRYRYPWAYFYQLDSSLVTVNLKTRSYRVIPKETVWETKQEHLILGSGKILNPGDLLIRLKPPLPTPEQWLSSIDRFYSSFTVGQPLLLADTIIKREKVQLKYLGTEKLKNSLHNDTDDIYFKFRLFNYSKDTLWISEDKLAIIADLEGSPTAEEGSFESLLAGICISEMEDKYIISVRIIPPGHGLDFYVETVKGAMPAYIRMSLRYRVRSKKEKTEQQSCIAQVTWPGLITPQASFWFNPMEKYFTAVAMGLPLPLNNTKSPKKEKVSLQYLGIGWQTDSVIANSTIHYFKTRLCNFSKDTIWVFTDEREVLNDLTASLTGKTGSFYSIYSRVIPINTCGNYYYSRLAIPPGYGIDFYVEAFNGTVPADIRLNLTYLARSKKGKGEILPYEAEVTWPGFIMPQMLNTRQ